MPSRTETTGEFRVREATRARLLDAAARVYAQFGYHGSTTRAIAAEADVSEVTLFRLFGSKEALLEAAIDACACETLATPLPEEPSDPEREVAEWCAAELSRLREVRHLLRKCFADAEEHPSHIRKAAGGVESAAAELRRYVQRLGAAGWTAAGASTDAAIAMLMATLLGDALGRQDLEAIFPMAPDDAPAMYARVFVVSLGITQSSGSRQSPPPSR